MVYNTVGVCRYVQQRDVLTDTLAVLSKGESGEKEELRYNGKIKGV